MRGQKNCRVFLLALLVLVVVPLNGCQSGKDIPFYLMETHGDYSEILYINSLRLPPNSLKRKSRTWHNFFQKVVA